MFQLFATTLLLIALCFEAYASTIAIIDTGFDLDHEFLAPKISNAGFDNNFKGWNFHDNGHVKKSVVPDKALIQEILLFRNLRAKGHKEGLTIEEFEWFKKRSSDPVFMGFVKKFKKQSHGTFVAGIALREGENINIFPIRGLSIPHPVVAVEDNSLAIETPLTTKTPEEQFKEKMNQSLNRVTKKFSNICHYISSKNIQIVNASYGITQKNITQRFENEYRKLTGKNISPEYLQESVNKYFSELYSHGEKTISKYPKILFIFSAGNTGLDNDSVHHYPSRIKTTNTLSVGAMNGEYLAGFSNFGKSSVDIGAPGVAILSIVPKVYSENGVNVYSPASGTSMAAPHVANLAAQILNINPRLKAAEIKKIIIETGNEKEYLKEKLISASIVDNKKAIRATLLSRDMPLHVAINLSKSNLIPVEDSISIGQAPAVAAEQFTQKVFNTIPQAVSPLDVDDSPVIETFTNELSSLPKDQEKEQQDNLKQQPSVPLNQNSKSSDQDHSNQNEEQSLKLSEDLPASSSQSEPKPLEAQSQESSPSLPQ